MNREASAPTRTSRGWEIPIIDGKRVIVGWTSNAPNNVGALIDHPEAEKMIGGAVVAAYVELENPVDAMRAGAPLGWRGPWRCIALCTQSMVRGDTILGTANQDGGIEAPAPPKR